MSAAANQVKRAWAAGNKELAWSLYQLDETRVIQDKAKFMSVYAVSFDRWEREEAARALVNREWAAQ